MQAMQILTSLVLAAFAFYLGAGTSGNWKATSRCCCSFSPSSPVAYWLAERFVLCPGAGRRPGHGRTGRRPPRRTAAHGHLQVDINVDEARKARLLMQPWWLDWTAGLFPVILLVFPAALVPVRALQDSVGLDDSDAAGRRPDSGEQVPLRRAPAGDQQEDHPDGTTRWKRGDVMVFRYPPDPGMDYIKRVVGVPGDEVAMSTKSSASTERSR
jgi:signal peptidase I